MATFLIRKDAESWFSKLKGTRACKLDFDMYYFCLMAGLASGERNDPSGEGRKSKPFLAAGGGIPQKYLGFQRLIFGLLVYAEIKRLGIKLAAKEEVKQKIKEMVAHDSPTGLSDLGLDLLNQYSSGGYDKLIKTRDVPPEKAHEFLRWYHGDFLAGLLKKKSFLISK